jgi:hypothetical protein
MAPPSVYDPGLLEAHIESLRKGQILPENVVWSLCEKVRIYEGIEERAK